MGSILGGFFKRFRKGDSLHKAVTKDNLDKLFNILEDIQGVNCRIEKPTDAEGKGWRIVIDGSSDELPPGDTTTPWEMEAENFDYPWRVVATPDGSGGATLSMAPGALVVDTANGPSMLTGIRLGSDYRHISATGYVFVRYATDVTAATARFAANVPANTSDYNYLPVAKITKDGVDYAVEQYLAGAFFAYVTVDEEV